MMTIQKINTPISPIDEADKINELVDGVNAAAMATDVETALSAKQDTLVSGTNIKTVNNNSLLGNGDLTIATAWGDIGGTLSNQTDLQNALNGKANDADVVHLAGDETITGHKIFTKNIDRNVNVIRGQIPSSDSYSGIRFIDNNNNWLAGLEYSLLTDKSSHISLILSDSVEDTTNIKGIIEIGEFNDGNIYTYAPACGINGSILTTVNKFKGLNGYFKLGNGLIIQWGYDESTSSGRTITFPTPFISAYGLSIVKCGQSGVHGDYTCVVGSETLTNFKVFVNTPIRWIAIGY